MSSISSSSRGRVLSLALLTFLASPLAACGSDRPTPAYPVSADPALEDTDLYEYVAGDEADEEDDYGDAQDEAPFETLPADGGAAEAASGAGAGTPPQAPAPTPPTGG